MERELEKTLLEIECSIKDHERRGNTHTQSVLEQARDIIGTCAQAARTPSDLKEILDRETTGGWIPVEERLPDEPKENPEFEGKKIELYLVTVKGTKYPFRAFWNGKQFTDGWSVLDVIAWRPLPETYQAERSEE